MANEISKEDPQQNNDTNKNEAAAGPPKTRRPSWEDDDVVEVIEPYSPTQSLEEGTPRSEGGAKKREKNAIEK